MHRLLFLQALIEPLIRVKMLSPLALRTRKPLSPCLALGKRARANLRVVCQSTRPRGDPAPPQAAATVVVEPLSASAGEEEDAVTCIANGVDGVTCFLDSAFLRLEFIFGHCMLRLAWHLVLTQSHDARCECA